MSLASLRFKHHLAVGTVHEFSQSRERGLAAFPQIGDDFLEHYVQAVGSFALAHTRPPGQLPGDIRLSHFGITIAGHWRVAVRRNCGLSGKRLKWRDFGSQKFLGVRVTAAR
jgi:hypothetical protein